MENYNLEKIEEMESFDEFIIHKKKEAVRLKKEELLNNEHKALLDQEDKKQAVYFARIVRKIESKKKQHIEKRKVVKHTKKEIPKELKLFLKLIDLEKYDTKLEAIYTNSGGYYRTNAKLVLNSNVSFTISSGIFKMFNYNTTYNLDLRKNGFINLVDKRVRRYFKRKEKDVFDQYGIDIT